VITTALLLSIPAHADLSETSNFLEPYDCNVGYINWEQGWSLDKKTWCCAEKQLGCIPSHPYDCEVGYENWQDEWSFGQKVWCCEKQGRGCPSKPAPWVPVQSSAPTSPPSTPPAPVEPYVCEDGLSMAETGWSADKKRWCCANKHLGCPTTGCDVPCVFDHVSHTCAERVLWSASHTFIAQENSCALAMDLVLQQCPMCNTCTFQDAGCQAATTLPPLLLETTQTVPLTTQTLPPTTQMTTTAGSGTTIRYALPSAERAAERAREAPSTTTVPTPHEEETFDCEYGLSQWETVWSGNKKEWCCNEKQVGCPKHKSKAEQDTSSHSGEEEEEEKGEDERPSKAPAAQDKEQAPKKVAASSSSAKKEEEAPETEVDEVDEALAAQDKEKAPKKVAASSSSSAKREEEAPETEVDEVDEALAAQDKEKAPKKVAASSSSSSAKREEEAPETEVDEVDEDRVDCDTSMDDWSEHKAAWCCQHESKGCQQASSKTRNSAREPYQCTGEKAGSVHEWSDVQKRWCCTFYSVGCESKSDSSEHKDDDEEKPAKKAEKSPFDGHWIDKRGNQVTVDGKSISWPTNGRVAHITQLDDKSLTMAFSGGEYHARLVDSSLIWDVDDVWKRAPGSDKQAEPAPAPEPEPSPAPSPSSSSAAPPSASSGEGAADDRVRSVLSAIDRDGNGHLNFTEINLLQQAANVDSIKQSTYDQLCKEFGEDPKVGLGVETLSSIYARTDALGGGLTSELQTKALLGRLSALPQSSSTSTQPSSLLAAAFAAVACVLGAAAAVSSVYRAAAPARPRSSSSSDEAELALVRAESGFLQRELQDSAGSRSR